MGKRWTFVWVLGAMAAGACGGGTTSGGTTTTGIPVEQSQFAAKFAQSVCSAMASCCTSNHFTYDPQICTNGLRGQLDSALLAQNSLHVVYNADAAGDCIAAYSNALRACDGTLSSVDSPCQHIFTGTIQPGGACTESSECVDPTGQSAYCDAGVCVVDNFSSGDPMPGVAGDPCLGTCTRETNGWSCGSSGGIGTGGAPTATVYCFTNDGLHCSSSSGLCEALPATLGAACDYDGCVAPYYCSAGTCAPQQATGPCTDDRACIATAYCDPDTLQCALKKADGAACVYDSSCTGGGCNDGTCGPIVPVSAALCAGLLD